MAGKGFRLNWKGAEARARLVKAVIAGVHELNLEGEREAKRILKKGHGVITGTLRRSIHADSPTYEWGSDDVVPSKESPERGKVGGMPIEQGDTVVGTIGSGLVYAMAIHEGFGSFPGYHYITLGHAKIEHKLLGKLEKHARKQGMK